MPCVRALFYVSLSQGMLMQSATLFLWYVREHSVAAVPETSYYIIVMVNLKNRFIGSQKNTSFL